MKLPRDRWGELLPAGDLTVTPVEVTAKRFVESGDGSKTAGGRVRKATVAAPGLSLKKSYQSGEVIAGKYVLLEKLGEGGMGAVWRAHNETLDVDVAIKLIRAEEVDAADGSALLGERLLQEARAAAQLGHPAIARVFDFGVSDREDPFIVMELLKGEDLADTLSRRGRISATKAVATLLPIAHALEAAHQKGIVHRDIKPENIYLARSEDGRVQPKLVDFGVAKIERNKNHRLTQTGAMLGSPVYMSPEQARGDDVDRLADVWAISVVLYEMVTGRPPFEGKNYNALLYSIIADEPPTITSFGTGDEDLWHIVRRGLEKDPDKRWPSMQLLGASLARWMIERGVHEDITGASIAAQWLRRIQSGADALASMLPPADDLLLSLESLPTTKMRVDVGREVSPLAATDVSRGRRKPAVRMPRFDRRVRRVALGGTAVGVLLVIGLSLWSWRDEAVTAGDSPGTAPVSVSAEALAGPNEAADVELLPAASAPDIDALREPAPASAPEVEAQTGATPNASNAPVGVEAPGVEKRKAPASGKDPAARRVQRPPHDKAKLKNPFD